MTDRRRRQKEQRAAKLEAEKKQEARKELGRRLGTALVFGVVVVGIVVAGAYFGSDEGELPQGYAGVSRAANGLWRRTARSRAGPLLCRPEPQTDVTAGSTVTVTLETSCGDIVIELDRLAPRSQPTHLSSWFVRGSSTGRCFIESSRISGSSPAIPRPMEAGVRLPDRRRVSLPTTSCWPQAW